MAVPLKQEQTTAQRYDPSVIPAVIRQRNMGTRPFAVHQGQMRGFIVTLINVEEVTGHISVTTPPIFATEKRTEKSTDSILDAKIQEAFLQSVYAYSEQAEKGRGSLLVVKHIDSLLRSGNFASVDRLLSNIDLSRVEPEIGFSFLTITAPARRRLNSKIRETFTANLRLLLMESRSAEYVDELLQKYK